MIALLIVLLRAVWVTLIVDLVVTWRRLNEARIERQAVQAAIGRTIATETYRYRLVMPDGTTSEPQKATVSLN